MGRDTRWYVVGALVALVVSALSFAQSAGYWALSAVNGEPTRVLLVDHAGPAVTSSLVGVATAFLALALLRAGRSSRSR